MRNTLALLLLAILLVPGCGFFSRPRQGNKVNETWETTNKTFKIRVTAYAEENGGFVGGAYYLFQSTAYDSDTWRDILTFRHDDPVAIPRDQVRFVNDKTAFVFMGWMYAVTSDGGITWTVWNAQTDLPKWSCCNYRLVKDVRIMADGTGIMTINPIPERQGEVPELHTTDYGQHWSS